MAPGPSFCVCLSLEVMDVTAALMSRGWAAMQPATSVPTQLQLLLWPPEETPGKLEDSAGTCSAQGGAGLGLCASLTVPRRVALGAPRLRHGAPSLYLLLRRPSNCPQHR